MATFRKGEMYGFGSYAHYVEKPIQRLYKHELSLRELTSIARRIWQHLPDEVRDWWAQAETRRRLGTKSEQRPPPFSTCGIQLPAIERPSYGFGNSVAHVPSPCCMNTVGVGDGGRQNKARNVADGRGETPKNDVGFGGATPADLSSSGSGFGGTASGGLSFGGGSGGGGSAHRSVSYSGSGFGYTAGCDGHSHDAGGVGGVATGDGHSHDAGGVGGVATGDGHSHDAGGVGGVATGDGHSHDAGGVGGVATGDGHSHDAGGVGGSGNGDGGSGEPPSSSKMSNGPITKIRCLICEHRLGKINHHFSNDCPLNSEYQWPTWPPSSPRPVYVDTTVPDPKADARQALRDANRLHREENARLRALSMAAKGIVYPKRRPPPETRKERYEREALEMRDPEPVDPLLISVVTYYPDGYTGSDTESDY